MQWHDVLADKSLKDLPYKIELNEWGNIEMSPTSVIHSVLQSRMAVLLQNQLGGQVFTELAIETSLGVRVPDVAWGSDEYLRKHQQELYASKAPEICIEIVSPSNHPQEMRSKTRLFLEAGAIEVWLVDETGTFQIFDEKGQQDTTRFPIEIGSLIKRVTGLFTNSNKL